MACALAGEAGNATASLPQTAQPAASAKIALRRVLVAESVPAALQFPPASATGFVSLAPALAHLNEAELTNRLAQAESQYIDEPLLVALAQATEMFARHHNYPRAAAIIPAQNIDEGIVRVALVLNPPVIRQILIGEGLEETEKLTSAPGAGFVVLSPAFSAKDQDELAKRLVQSENQVFNEKLAAAIAQVIEIYFKQNDYPLATAVVPPQNTEDGTVRIALLRGRIRNIRVAGNRWFSDSLLREKLRIEQGEPLRLSELDRALGWTNNNPFRHVRVRIDAVGTGEADLIVAVQEAVPLRLHASFDTGGNEVIGEHRFTGSATYANVWGRDHQASYQFVTTNLGPHIFQAHGLDYRVPLPWRDYLQFSASYLRAQPSFFDGLIKQDGVNVLSNLRYTHPLRTGDNPIEVYAGLDFKQSNNNLAFGGAEVLATKTDIFQFTAGGSILRRDKRGGWVFGASVVMSPGGMNSRNSDATFHDTRALAKSRYIYGQLTFQRFLQLHKGWDFTCRGVAQFSGNNLLSSEQLYVGGASSVRGFDENVFGGDEGFLFTQDLLAPTWKRKVPFLPKNRNVLETRLLGFYDIAHVRVKHPTNVDTQTVPIASAGVGLRMNVATNFSLSADYGWQITNLPYVTEEKSRGHLRATLAF